MGDVVYLALMFACAAVGGFIGYKLKIPVGGMLGAMVAVIIFNIITEPELALPVEFRVGLQLAFGPLIGGRLTKADMIGLKKLAFPVFVLLVCMLSLNILFGAIMYFTSDLDIPTTLFATAPGGMMDMAIVSADLGANYVYVALLQMARILFIMIFMIPFYRKVILKFAKSTAQNDAEPALEPRPNDTNQLNSIKPEGLPPEPKKLSRQIQYFFMTALCGAIPGLIFWQLGIPAGAIVGAMIGAGTFNVLTGKGYFPPGLRLPLQMLAGSFIGLRMDRASLLAMGEIIVPILIIFAAVVFMTVITAFVVHKLTGLDVVTSLMASTPGGLSEMTMLADELKLDAPKVVVMQTFRLMSVIILFPSILTFVLWLLG